ncbi:unnamed protein product [Prunus armeniaca]|uniref:Uncharacterized protein n=1 Tax=Prunus armeniaca TaxID=36596 RepID=A0A6J5Y6H8_PRUAR|nr:unnamed protein product [Prunus armeniaca]CAB4319575.1 unnamed protein product [Prunus armeniaca]
MVVSKAKSGVGWVGLVVVWVWLWRRGSGVEGWLLSNKERREERQREREREEGGTVVLRVGEDRVQLLEV